MASSNDSVHSKEASLSTDNDDVNKVSTCGEHNEYVIIGGKKYLRHELMHAFGGTLNPGLSPPPKHQIANPSPLGLCAFGLTTFVLSMFNAQAMGITHPQVVVGLACFYGGGVQLLAGLWEFIIGNTFGATALTSYGAFWLAYGAIQAPAFGIKAAYGTDTVQLANGIGFFLLGWGIFTFMLTLCTLKSTLSFSAIFVFLTTTFFVLAAGDLLQSVKCTRAGGVLGIITAFIAFYNAFAGVANRQNSYMVPKPLPLTERWW